VTAQQGKLRDVSKVPSVAMIDDMRAAGIPFYRFALDQALTHKAGFQAQALSDAERQHFEEVTRVSMREHAEMEANPGPSFEDYLRRMLATYESL